MAALLVLGAAQAQQSDPPAKRIITQGLAKTVTEDLIPCANPKPGMNLRKNPVGDHGAGRHEAHRAGRKQFRDGSEAAGPLQ